MCYLNAWVCVFMVQQEEYVFALEWEPEWNYGSDCVDLISEHMTPTSHAANYLSVHGLWPNYNSTLHDGLSW